VWEPLTRPAACFVGAGKAVCSTSLSGLSTRSADIISRDNCRGRRCLTSTEVRAEHFKNGRMTEIDLAQGGTMGQNKVGF
jgi:hypothetical protein